MAVGGLFLGACTSLFFALAYFNLLPQAGSEILLGIVLLLANVIGILASFICEFLYPDIPDAENPIEAKIVPYVAIGLNVWPWMLLFVSLWSR